MNRETPVRQISLLPPDAAELIYLVRENVRLLSQIVEQTEVMRIHAYGSGCVIRNPADIASYLGPELIDLAQEQLRVIMLDVKNHVLGVTLVYQGGRNAAVIRLADCFREAVRTAAEAIILMHNHPSGDPTPSDADVHLTNEASEAGDLLGITVLDHVVVGRAGFVSLREQGLFTPARYSPRGHGAVG